MLETPQNMQEVAGANDMRLTTLLLLPFAKGLRFVPQGWPI
jgi:hypothetical protein